VSTPNELDRAEREYEAGRRRMKCAGGTAQDRMGDLVSLVSLVCLVRFVRPVCESDEPNKPDKPNNGLFMSGLFFFNILDRLFERGDKGFRLSQRILRELEFRDQHTGLVHNDQPITLLHNLSPSKIQW
jgi:hypothetical protein